MMITISAAERARYFVGRVLARCFYRVNVLGLENLPSGGFLLLPNHISWVDAVVLQLACPRPIRYVIDEEYYRKPILHPFCARSAAFPSLAASRIRDRGSGKNRGGRDRLRFS
jgi:acyl-[acyl-carrier-protein]-phospholipid O-acyltransferase/long-chain-fatty-acid--[acyl-carrier-protein] ligase